LFTALPLLFLFFAFGLDLIRKGSQLAGKISLESRELDDKIFETSADLIGYGG
jgi:hypothetical protein